MLVGMDAEPLLQCQHEAIGICRLESSTDDDGKRFKIHGILRDILRQKSMGIIEEIPEKGIVKYAKPVGASWREARAFRLNRLPWRAALIWYTVPFCDDSNCTGT